MNAVYRAGSWFLLVGPSAFVALPPDSPAELVAQLWERVRSDGASFSDVVDALTAAGRGSVAAIPPFAAVVREGDDARVAIRGRVSAWVAGSAGEHEITGAEVTTWSERFVPAVRGAEVVLEEDRDGIPLPIEAGVVRAARLGFGEVRDAEPVPLPEPVEGTQRDDVAPAVEVPIAAADAPLMAVPAPVSAVEASATWHAPALTDQDDDVDDTVLSPASPDAVPVETILPPADTFAVPLGGHTLDLQPVGGADARANEVFDEGDGDHDGATISLAQARALRGVHPNEVPSGPVPSAGVPAGPTAPPTTAPQIRMSTGQVVALDRTVVIGRRPRATRSTGATLPHLIAVDSPQQDISRSHLEIRPEADAIVVLDLHTTNGSTLLRPGADPVRLHPGEQTIVVSGDVIDLGDGVTVAFEELP